MRLIAISVQLAMVDAADGDRVLIADLAAKRARLRKANVVRFGGRAAADDAGLRGDESVVLVVAQTIGLGRNATALDNGRFRGKIKS